MFWNKKLKEEIECLKNQLVQEQLKNRRLEYKLSNLEKPCIPVKPISKPAQAKVERDSYQPSYHQNSDTFVEDVIQAAATYYIMDTIMDNSSSDSYDSGSSYDSSDCGSFGSDD